MKETLKETLKRIGGGYLLNEGASPKLMKTITDTMKYDAYGDLEDLINGLNLDKKYYGEIDGLLDDIRDEEQGIKPSGSSKSSKKQLLKVLKKAVITKRK